MKIQVTNDSTVVSMEDAAAWTTACAMQLRDDFCPMWERTPPIVEFSGDGKVDPSAYHVAIVDDTPQADALGYHDNDEQGKPRAFIFAKTTKDAGEDPAVTLSHEILEMTLDPSCSLWTQAGDGNMRAYEACDAVQDTSYPKHVGDVVVAVSNFLCPNYFTLTPIHGLPFDFLGKLTAPAPARTVGGYDIVQATQGEPTQEFRKHFALLPEWKRNLKERTSSRTSRRVKKAAP